MSKEKAREFWINKRQLDEEGIPFVAQGKPDQEFINHSGVYHVIEYSAFEQERARAERFKKALERIEATGNDDKTYDETVSTYSRMKLIAREALKGDE